jgi:broad specificity phosphatase PhoE
MSPSTRIYLVRHGRTTLNAEGKFRGRLDPSLDDEGVRQAEAAARRLMVDPPVHVFSSPLRRAVETAAHIARLAGAPRTTEEDLIDLDYGAWAGLSPEEASGRDPRAFAVYRDDPERAVPPDGEPPTAVADRCLKALQRMAESFPGRTIAAVSHEIPIRLCVARIAGLKGSEPWDLLVPTGTVVRVAVADGTFELPVPRPVLVSRRWTGVNQSSEPRP